MRLIARINGLKEGAYYINVDDKYENNFTINEEKIDVKIDKVDKLKAHYITSNALIIAHWYIKTHAQSGQMIRIDGDSVILSYEMYDDELEPNKKSNYCLSQITISKDFRKDIILSGGVTQNCILIIISRSFLEHLFNPSDPIYSQLLKSINFKTEPTAPIKSTLAEILTLPSTCQLAHALIETKVKELFIYHLEEYLKSTSPQSLSHATLHAVNTIEKAKSILDQKYVNPPLIVELARMVGISECKLKTEFKQKYNISIYQYVIHRKMQEALRLLKEKKHTITSITNLIGYKHVSHFSYAFTKYYGIGPAELLR